jgi:cell division protein FtsZ
MAVSSPLLEASIEGAHGVLLSIAGGSDLGLHEVSDAANLIEAAAHEDANIIFGTVIDDALGDEVRVTVIAAGFDGGTPPRRSPGTPLARQQAARTSAPSTPHPAPPEPVVAEPVRGGSDELDVPDFMR